MTGRINNINSHFEDSLNSLIVCVKLDKNLCLQQIYHSQKELFIIRYKGFFSKASILFLTKEGCFMYFLKYKEKIYCFIFLIYGGSQLIELHIYEGSII